jgi:hypothetical protein
MSNKKPDSKEDDEKSVGNKVIDIIHGLFNSKSEDPVITETIKNLRETSPVGGERRKKKIDAALKEAGG